MDKELGARIQRLREKRDMSQRELARRVGLSNSVLSRVEDGTRKARADELVKISDTLGVSIEFLTGNTSYEKKKGPGSAESTAPEPYVKEYVDFIRKIEDEFNIDLTDKKQQDFLLQSLRVVFQIRDIEGRK